MANVLYIHGMGGGRDSRIPSILQECLSSHPGLKGESVSIICRTYEFDPETASEQICAWVEETAPALIIGESLGSLHAIRVKGVPHILVSPALNAPFYFELLSWLVLLPGVTWIFDRIYRPREGDRQKLHFIHRTLRKYLPLRRHALMNSRQCGSDDYFHAFFGTRDHYRRSGIVSIRTWKKHFGKTYTMYDGTHFMEDEFVRGILAELIINILSSNK